MNQRALVALGVLLGVAYGKSPSAMLSTLHREVRSLQAKDPANTAAGVVVVAAILFYAAERGHNPKIASFYDALVYTSTNISVGFCDILAQTPMGKAIGSVLMTYGPAIATRALDAPNTDEASLKDIATRLDKILDELVQQRAPRSTTTSA